MILSQLKTYLSFQEELHFHLPDGRIVKPHAHLTELGSMHKKYLDCGGQLREDKFVTMQLWEADDTDHRLSPDKFISIIDKSTDLLNLEDLPIRVEYQTGTVGLYELKQRNGRLTLAATQTECQSPEQCGVPVKKVKIELKDLGTSKASCCTPGSGCC